MPLPIHVSSFASLQLQQLAWKGSTEGSAAHALQGPYKLGIGKLRVRMLSLEAGPQFLPGLSLLFDLAAQQCHGPDCGCHMSIRPGKWSSGSQILSKAPGKSLVAPKQSEHARCKKRSVQGLQTNAGFASRGHASGLICRIMTAERRQ